MLLGSMEVDGAGRVIQFKPAQKNTVPAGEVEGRSLFLDILDDSEATDAYRTYAAVVDSGMPLYLEYPLRNGVRFTLMYDPSEQKGHAWLRQD